MWKLFGRKQKRFTSTLCRFPWVWSNYKIFSDKIGTLEMTYSEVNRPWTSEFFIFPSSVCNPGSYSQDHM